MDRNGRDYIERVLRDDSHVGFDLFEIFPRITDLYDAPSHYVRIQIRNRRTSRDDPNPETYLNALERGQLIKGMGHSDPTYPLLNLLSITGGQDNNINMLFEDVHYSVPR